MDRKCLEYGSNRYGTPLYVFDIDEMKEIVDFFQRSLKGKAGLCFAMKANSFLTRQMAAVTDRVEVCSMGEFEICRNLGIEPEKILISGVLKKQEDIITILEFYRGNCTYTVESLNQLNILGEWSSKNKESVSVYLRLTSGNQFGMDEMTIDRILMERQEFPFVKIKGIHFFSGTQKKTTEKIKKEIAYLDEFMEKMETEHGFPLEELEYGPGIPVSYFEGQNDKREEFACVLSDVIDTMKWKGSVILEMGRAFVADCGYYMTTVKDIKTNDKVNYCIVDGGIHQIHYDGQIRGMYHPELQIIPERNNSEIDEYTICGSLCTVNDILIKNVHIPALEVGDVLIFKRAGAYAMTEGMALFLSHELPCVTFYSKGEGWKLVREEKSTFRWNMEKETEDGNVDEYFNGN